MMARTAPDKQGIRQLFCSFVCSNSSADPFREAVFHALSGYKTIDSGGRFLNNVGGPVEDKVAFEQQYKFSLAMENTSHPGYTTEKLVQAFAAGGVPIYWGDPRISEMFRPETFIDMTDCKTPEEAVQKIADADRNPDQYLSYFSESPIREEYRLENFWPRYEASICHIFDQEIEEAGRLTRQGRNMLNARKEQTMEAMYANRLLRKMYEITGKG